MKKPLIAVAATLLFSSLAQASAIDAFEYGQGKGTTFCSIVKMAYASGSFPIVCFEQPGNIEGPQDVAICKQAFKQSIARDSDCYKLSMGEVQDVDPKLFAEIRQYYDDYLKKCDM